ncbi:MAG: S41 family peptidase [Finegoldia magna]|uniref:Peptidase family S41 n=3 Tax=Finegoldia magna TaxID=1260 RepID=A0A6N2ZBV7_FINMA|nr:S41 family peptidase [Finegoldia magna]MDU2639028.1 S41 family peptidase [Finegoldia magna]
MRPRIIIKVMDMLQRQTLSKKIKLVVVMIFFITTTSFVRQDEIITISNQDLIDYINTSNVEKYDSHKIDGTEPISSYKYKKQVMDIRDFMEDNHAFYDKANIDEITNSYNELLTDTKNKTVLDLNLDLMKVISKYKQGHVSIIPIDMKKSEVFIAEFNEKYYIVEANEQFNNLLGSEVISINNIKIEDVVDRLDTYAIGENKSFRRRQQNSFLNSYDILKKENVMTEKQNIYELKTGDKIIKVDIPFVKSDDLIVSKLKINGRKTDMLQYERKRTSNENNVSIKPLSYPVDVNRLHYIETEGDNLILRYNSCTENDNYKIEKFTKDVCDKLDSNKFSNIIIDLRYNSGGDSSYIFNIFSKMMAYQGANPKTKIKVLVSDSTYSAAGDCALLFVKNFHNVEVIGTDSGFPVLTSAGNVNMFYTKDTYFQISYCMMVFREHYENVDSYLFNYMNFDFDRNTMTPDFHAEQSFADYMIGNDPAMNYALRDEK